MGYAEPGAVLRCEEFRAEAVRLALALLGKKKTTLDTLAESAEEGCTNCGTLWEAIDFAIVYDLSAPDLYQAVVENVRGGQPALLEFCARVLRADRGFSKALALAVMERLADLAPAERDPSGEATDCAFDAAAVARAWAESCRKPPA